jgi:glutathione S-transferase
MTSPRPLLYTYRRCPYAMRARMALLVAGVPFDAQEIVLRDKPATLLEASPKGTVPVLVLTDGGVIEQSWDIVRWALTQPNHADSELAWWHGAQEPRNATLLQLNDGAFKYHLDRYKYPERFSTEQHVGIHDVRAHHRTQAVQALLEPLEMRLADAAFLGGESPCATDLGIFPFIRQFAAIDPTWFDHQPLGQVQRWLAHWLQSPLFNACMAKLPANRPTHFQPLAPAESTGG